MPLEKIIVELEQNIEHSQKMNAAISSKNVAWQIDHILRVVIGTCKLLKKSNPEDYKWKFNKTKTFIFLKGSIPRGIAKAPKSVISEQEISLEELKNQIKEAKQQIEAINDLPKKANFKHPYFGYLDLKESRKFLNIHSQHHLKIIKDIISN